MHEIGHRNETVAVTLPVIASGIGVCYPALETASAY